MFAIIESFSFCVRRCTKGLVYVYFNFSRFVCSLYVFFCHFFFVKFLNILSKLFPLILYLLFHISSPLPSPPRLRSTLRLFISLSLSPAFLPFISLFSIPSASVSGAQQEQRNCVPNEIFTTLNTGSETSCKRSLIFISWLRFVH